MSPLQQLVATSFAVAFSAGLRAQASVHVVDQLSGPGSQYTEIAAAVAAAGDGDVVLVRSGGYQPFVVDGKALVIEGDAGAQPSVFALLGGPAVAVRNLPAGEEVVLRNLSCSTNLGAPLQLEVADCAGSVLLEDLQVEGGGPSVRVSQCAAVTLVSCTVFGQHAVPGGPWSAGRGLVAEGSNVFVYGCDVRGGNGVDGAFPGSPPAAGQTGCRIDGGSLFAAGSSFAGGAGGDGSATLFGGCTGGAAGGTGLWLASGDPQVTTLACPLASGAPGLGFGACPGGTPGAPLVVDTGVHRALAAAFRSMSVSSPLREGQADLVSLQGLAGDYAVLVAGPAQAPARIPALTGVLVPDLGSAVLLPLGFVDATGAKTVGFTVQELGAGVLAAGVHLQVAFVETPLLAVVLGNSSHVLLLDQGL